MRQRQSTLRNQTAKGACQTHCRTLPHGSSQEREAVVKQLRIPSCRLISRHCHVSHAQMHADFKGPNPDPYSDLVNLFQANFGSGHVHILWTSRLFF